MPALSPPYGHSLGTGEGTRLSTSNSLSKSCSRTGRTTSRGVSGDGCAGGLLTSNGFSHGGGCVSVMGITAVCDEKKVHEPAQAKLGRGTLYWPSPRANMGNTVGPGFFFLAAFRLMAFGFAPPAGPRLIKSANVVFSRILAAASRTSRNTLYSAL